MCRQFPARVDKLEPNDHTGSSHSSPHGQRGMFPDPFSEMEAMVFSLTQAAGRQTLPTITNSQGITTTAAHHVHQHGFNTRGGGAIGRGGHHQQQSSTHRTSRLMYSGDDEGLGAAVGQKRFRNELQEDTNITSSNSSLLHHHDHGHMQNHPSNLHHETGNLYMDIHRASQASWTAVELKKLNVDRSGYMSSGSPSYTGQEYSSDSNPSKQYSPSANEGELLFFCTFWSLGGRKGLRLQSETLCGWCVWVSKMVLAKMVRKI